MTNFSGRSPSPRIAIWQGPSAAGDVEHAIETVAKAMLSVSAAGGDMLVFPELFLPGYNSDNISSITAAENKAWKERLSIIARDNACGLTVGYAECVGDTLYNSALVFDQNGLQLANYRKIQLYGAREKSLFSRGDAYVTFDFAGIRTAVLICYDIEFAHHVAALKADGVRLILVPTANMMPFEHVSNVTVPAQSLNHALSIVYANYCGSEGDLDYLGESLIVSNDGTVLAKAGPASTIMVVELIESIDQARLSQQECELLIV